jgi:ATP-dependent DNA helicase RecG
MPRQADDLATELVAFANTQGGVVLLGVNDDGQVAGLTDDPRAL